MVLAPVTRPTQPLEELPERQVQGRVPVVRARLGADHGPAVDDGELDTLTAACLAGVRLVRHDDVDALGAGGQLLDFRELLLDVRPVLREHLGVPAGNHDLHVSLLRGSGAGRARPRVTVRWAAPGGSRAASPPPAAGPVDPVGVGSVHAVGSGPHANPAPVREPAAPADGSSCGRSRTGWQPRRAVRTGGRRERHGADDPGTGALERRAARRDGRAGGQHVVHDEDVPVRQSRHVPRRHPDVAGEVARARPGTRARPGRGPARGRARAPARRAPRPAQETVRDPRRERVHEVAAPASARRGRRRAGHDQQRPGTRRRRRARRPRPRGRPRTGASGRADRGPSRRRPRAGRGRCSRRASTPAAARGRPAGRAAGRGPRTATADRRGGARTTGTTPTSSSPQPAHSTGTSRPSSSRANVMGRSMRADGIRTASVTWGRPRAVGGSSAREGRVRRTRHAQDLRPGGADEPAQLAVGRRDVDDRARRRGRPGSRPRAAPSSARRPGPGARPRCRRTARRPRASTPPPRPPTTRRPATRRHGPGTRAAAGHPTRRA